MRSSVAKCSTDVMVLSVTMVACIGFITTSCYASQAPYFINRVGGTSPYLLGLAGGINQPMAFSSGDGGQLRGPSVVVPNGTRRQGVLPGNLRLVLADHVTKSDVGGKQDDKERQVQIQSLVLQMQSMMKLLIEMMNSMSGMMVNQQGSSSQNSGEVFKLHPEQYEPTVVSQHEAHGSDVQLPNSGILPSTAEGDSLSTNDVIPVASGDELAASAAVGTKGLKQFHLRQRPGVVYLVPKRVSKAIEEDDQSPVMDTTTTTSPTVGDSR